jgi:intracellular septation protein A
MLNLLKAFRPLAVDFLSTIVFVAFYAITGNIRAGIALGIAVGIVQIGYIFWRGNRPDVMQWASLALVVVLGSASLITHDPRFVMLKPSIGAFAIACVMLKRGWMARYLPAIVKENVAAGVLVAWGYLWSATIFALGFANLFVALTLGPKIWTWYTAIVPISVQLGLFLLQYESLRWTVRRNIRGHMSAAPAE